MNAKKQISLIRKTLYGMMLVALFFAALGTGSLPTVRAQEVTPEPPKPEVLPPPTDIPEPTITEFQGEIPTESSNTINDEEQIRKAIEAVVNIQNNNSPKNQYISIGTINHFENWAISSVGYRYQDTNEIVGAGPALVLVHKENDAWLAVWQGSEQFYQWLPSIPEVLMSTEVKSLYAFENELPSDVEILSTALYELPWKGGTSLKVLQGNNNSSGSHNGSMAFAYDFGTYPSQNGEGTIIYAARDGIVAKVYDYYSNSECGGSSQANKGNYVLISHVPNDGTADLYLHIQPDSAREFSITTGTFVYRGQPIARLGHTGYTDYNGSGCTPHLHFQRQQYPGNGSWFQQSVETKFADESVISDGYIPLGDKYYNSDNYPLEKKSEIKSTWLNASGGWPYLADFSDDRIRYFSVDGSSLYSFEETGCYYEWVNLNPGEHTFVEWYEVRDSGSPTVDLKPWPVIALPVCADGPIDPPPGYTPDTTPPSGAWTNPSNNQTISSRSVTLSVNASDNSGGSGVKEVRFSAKWDGAWRGVGTVNSSPYSFSWDMCSSGVPNGDVELGFEVWDNANNKWVYSEHYSNIHINKNYTCTQGTDTTPPTGSWTSPSNGQTISSQSVTLSVNASDNSGGSGVREVRWSAKWNNQWSGIGVDTTAPYSINWDMCASAVPNGDIELGFEVWDNANNKWVYSEHYTNYHINKNYTCNSIAGGWETWGWQNKYLAGYDNWHGTVTWNDGYPYIWWDFGAGGPFGWGGNEFSLRMQKNVYFPGGDYSFHADHDDGVRVYLDGNLIIDAWWDGNGGHDAGRNITQGYHQVKVEFYENQGDALIHVLWYGPGYPRPDNNPPDGRITSPANHSATSYSPITISADAWDDTSGVDRVEFYVWYCDGSCGWHLIGTDYSSPYSVNWDWSALSDQHVFLTIHVIDKMGKVRDDPGGYVEVDLDRTSPTASITSPTEGSMLNGVVPIRVDASDSLSGVGTVQFLAGYNDTAGAGLQGRPEPPPPAKIGQNGEVTTSELTTQDYWKEIGWDNDGSDGWSFNWDTSNVPEQSGIAVFVYVYDKAGNYQGAVVWDLSLFKPPSNDDFDFPKVISQTPYTDTMGTTGATIANDDPALTYCERAPGEASVWYAYTPSTDGQIHVDTIGSDYDTMLAIWTGTRGSLELIDCNDDRPSDLQSELNVNVYGGTTYYIEVSQYNGFQAASLDTQPPRKPANLSPEGSKLNKGDAGALSVGGMLQFHMAFGQADLVITGITFSPALPPAGQPLFVSVQVTNQGDAMPPWFSVDVYVDREPAGCGDFAYERYGFDLPPGSTATINVPIADDLSDGLSQGVHQIWAYLDADCWVGESNDSNNWYGPIYITVGEPLPPPVNDNFDTPITISSLPYSETRDTRGATYASDDPAIDACNLNPGKGSVWYKVTPYFTGIYSFDTKGSDYDTVLAIWTGSRGNLIPIACNDDIGLINGDWDVDSILSTTLTAGTTYYIEVTKYGAPQSSGQNIRDKNNSSEKPSGNDLVAQSGGQLQLHIVPPYVSTTFRSIGAYDGWILEANEINNTGGTMDATTTTFNLGDSIADKQYRAILSFNTSSLPDTAVITKAMLQIRAYGSLVGNNNPFTWGQGLKVDVCKGTFGTNALQLTDFNYNNTTNCKLLVGTFGNTPVSGWYSANLVNVAFGKINPFGLTQFRLRFYKDDNDDNSTDYWRFFSGNYSAVGYRPTLIIEYYVPSSGLTINENITPTPEYHQP